MIALGSLKVANQYEGELPELNRTIRIPVAEFGRYYRKFSASTVKRMFERSMPAASKAVRDMLEEETIKRAIFFKKRFARGWRVRKGAVSGMSAQVYNKERYAIVIEKGRRKNKRPPPRAALIPWVIAKLGVSRRDAPRVAFLVARAIGRRGITARPVMTDPRMQIRIRKTLSGAVFVHMQQGMLEAGR